MISIKKVSIFFISAIISIAAISLDSSGQRRSPSSRSTKSKLPTKEACDLCLNYFSSEELAFISKEEDCISTIAKCTTKNLTPRCELSINECIKWNCTTSASCGDEIANRSLFYGCLKAEDEYMPYQCASYIKGYASSVASEQKAALEAEQLANQRELEAQKTAQAKAEAEAAQAAAQAEIEAAQLAAQAELEAQQIQAQAALELEQKRYELEQQAKLDELTRQAKLEEQKQNSKPNVKYNNLLSAVKKDISTAKSYASKAYNLLGIQKTDKEQTEGTVMFFPPQIISVDAVLAGSDAKSKSLKNGSKYRDAAKFVCTKDTKESFVKTELKNIYNTVKKSKDSLATGIAELEALNADDETIGSVSEDKITKLYQTQNKLTEIMNSIEVDMNSLTTTCETRCNGMQTMSMTSTSSGGGIEFDENGLIVDKSSSSTGGDEYSCKDFETSTDGGLDIMALISGETPDMSDMMGGIGKKVTELTKRVTKATLNADKALDEAEIAIQSGIFEIEQEYKSGTINNCIKYIKDTYSYTDCAQNVLSQLLLNYSSNQDNQLIKNELTNTINDIKASIKNRNAEFSLPSSCNNINTLNIATNCVDSLLMALEDIKQGREATGSFTTLVKVTPGVNGDLYIQTDNDSLMDPTTFARSVLDWDATKCSIVPAGQTINPYPNTYMGYGYMPQQMPSSYNIVCTCSVETTVNGEKTTSDVNVIKSIDQLNRGDYSSQCPIIKP